MSQQDNNRMKNKKVDTRATEDTLGELHGLIAKAFITKIKTGEFTSADLSAAIKFLKDNNINCIGTEDDSIKKLVDELPTFDDHTDRAFLLEPIIGDGFDPQYATNDVVLRAH